MYSSSFSVIPYHRETVCSTTGWDISLLAVANAVEVCLNSNPVSAQYDQKKMRRHLEDCLNDETLRSFPMCSTEPLPRPTHTVHKIKHYCICRMPEEYYERTICCDSCQPMVPCLLHETGTSRDLRLLGVLCVQEKR